MIKNFIFDIGRVLITWDPDYLIEVYFSNLTDEEKHYVREEFFSKDWPLQDGGLSQKDFYEMCVKKYPKHFHQGIYDTIYKWVGKITPLKESYEIVKMVKEKGYNLYILSNMPENYYELFDVVPALSFFDNTLFSYDAKIQKPNPEIFKLVLNKFNIKAEESLFIDDNYKNVSAAKALGISVYQFDENNIHAFYEYLKEQKLI